MPGNAYCAYNGAEPYARRDNDEDEAPPGPIAFALRLVSNTLTAPNRLPMQPLR